MLLTVVNNNYWYDHGTELGAAAITLIAVVIALINSAYTMSKDRKNKREDDKKTIYMLDLMTLDSRRDLYKNLVNIQSSELIERDMLGNEIIHFDDEIFPEATIKKHPSIQYDMKSLYRKNHFFSSEILNEVTDKYKESLESTLHSQYSNLYFESIKKIEKKIEKINMLRYRIKVLKNSEIRRILNESKDIDKERAEEVYKILGFFDNLESALDKTLTSLSENSISISSDKQRNGVR